MITARTFLLCSMVVLLALPAWGQARRDPLTYAEADEIRELAQEPVKRLRLMLEFTQARMATIDQLRTDARMAEGRGEKVRLLLEDFSQLTDEIERNIEMFADRGEDIRKALKDIVEATSGWTLKLRAMRESGGAGDERRQEPADYEYTLEDAVDSVNSLADTGRDVLDEQEVEFSKKKDDKKKQEAKAPPR